MALCTVPAVAADPADLVDEVESLTAEGIRLKEACAQVAAETGVSRRELYDAVLTARRDGGDSA